MTEKSSYPPGTPSWVDLTTTDADAAREFYARIFGWEYQIGPEETNYYTNCLLRGRPVAGLYGMDDETRASGMPPAWAVYMATDDAEALARRIGDAGGTIMLGPMDVMEFGRMLVAADPSGAAVAAWQAGQHTGAAIVSEPGAMAWHELITRDPDAAGPFYRTVFDYGAETMPMDGEIYTLFKLGDENVAGMMRTPPDLPPEVPSHWLVYFAVSDCDAALAEAQAAGGQVLLGPVDSPYGRFATVRDPQGAVFAVIRLPDQPA
jgi:predicted enzyme related to lactoylglutathione lyase